MSDVQDPENGGDDTGTDDPEGDEFVEKVVEQIHERHAEQDEATVEGGEGEDE
jgi:hypothetical protein